MDFSKLSNGQKIASGAGLVLIINLFLPWYGVGPFSANAFEDPAGFLAFGGSFLAIAGAVILLLKAMGTADASRGALAAEQVALLVGAFGFVLIVLQWVTENDFTKFGLFLGMIGAAVVTYGAFMTMKEKGIEMPDLEDIKSVTERDEPPSPDA